MCSASGCFPRFWAGGEPWHRQRRFWTSRRVRHAVCWGRLRDGGGGAITHRLRGRPSNRRIAPEIRSYAVNLVRERYVDFGPALAAEKLAELHDLKVSGETLRKWMIDAGLWLSRKQRRRFHQPRLRRNSLGELIQIDGSEHRSVRRSCPPLHAAGVH